MPRLLLALLAALAAVPALAAPWEVAVAFLGAGMEEAYQRDIDHSILELAKLRPGPELRLTVYREYDDRWAEFTWEPGAAAAPWDALFSRKLLSIQRPGRLRGEALTWENATLPLDPERLPGFLARAFRDPGARRLLFIYGHGEGPGGLRDVPVALLKQNLLSALPPRAGSPLDLLWLDACFMANLEAAYELRAVTPLLMASEESEFSAGMPYTQLQRLAESPLEPEEAARVLGAEFIQSYSYIEKGSQRRQVYDSSATVSLIDTRKLEPLVTLLASWVKRYGGRLPEEQRKAVRAATAKGSMVDRPWLVDAVSFFRKVRAIQQRQRPEGMPDPETHAVMSILEAGRLSKRQGNPPVHVFPPKPDSILVYGYNGWTKGYQADEATLAKLPPELSGDRILGYVPDQRGWLWPSRKVRAELVTWPFSVGLKVFDYFFYDPVTRSAIPGTAATLTRQRDYEIFVAESPRNPVLFSGYTQGIGANGNRYYGISLLDPTADAASGAYLDTDFAARTRWAGF
jgi:hypothetical protein